MVSNIVLCIIPTILVLIGVRKLRERSWGWCKNNVKLSNKVVVVTGANSGIGYEIVKELAGRDAQVILACRNVDAAEKAIRKIEKQLKRSVKLIAMELDLASLTSIQIFATNLQKLFPEIHVLINNAGVSFPRKEIHETQDGFEIHFGVNYLGHFYLTNLLLDTLRKSKPSRIVNVTSSLYTRGTIDINNLDVGGDKTKTKKLNLYATSKLENLYFSKELAKRVKNDGINVYAVCPGWVYTSLFRHSICWYHYVLIAPIAFFFMRSPKQGSQTPIYCATEPNLENETGNMYRNCRREEVKIKIDEEISLKLWNVSEQLITEKLK